MGCTRQAEPVSTLSDADLMRVRRIPCERTAPIAFVLPVRSFRYGCLGCGALRHSSSQHTEGTSCERRNRAPNVGSSNRDS